MGCYFWCSHTPQPLQNLVEPSWNPRGTLTLGRTLVEVEPDLRAAPDYPGAYWGKNTNRHQASQDVLSYVKNGRARTPHWKGRFRHSNSKQGYSHYDLHWFVFLKVQQERCLKYPFIILSH